MDDRVKTDQTKIEQLQIKLSRLEKLLDEREKEIESMKEPEQR